MQFNLGDLLVRDNIKYVRVIGFEESGLRIVCHVRTEKDILFGNPGQIKRYCVNRKNWDYYENRGYVPYQLFLASHIQKSPHPCITIPPAKNFITVELE